ncbi:hypothetical protein F5X97DRAFT_328988 [Nemania serpens]|nr:hypothetical protein F5X97DRAFT_328988 [Nemania serpens]
MSAKVSPNTRKMTPPAKPAADGERKRVYALRQTPRRLSAFPFRFLSLPPEIRNQVYEVILVPPHPVRLVDITDHGTIQVFGASWSWKRSTVLLRVNRQIRVEATAILFGRNQFTIGSDCPEALFYFLTCIGPVNASLITHLRVNFPSVDDVDCVPGQLTLRNPDVRDMQLIQRICTGLATLGLLIHCGNARIFTRTNVDHCRVVKEYFPQVDTLLKAIPSLGKVVISTHGINVQQSTKDAMRDFGWWFTG